MARRRYQQGQVFLRGKRFPVWIGRWREDIITPEGKIKRVRKSEVLGTRKQYPTKRLALRVLEDRLSPINDPSYRAAPTISFRAFADKWQKTVLVQHDPSTQKADRSLTPCPPFTRPGRCRAPGLQRSTPSGFHCSL